MSTAKRPETAASAPSVRIVPERPAGVRPSGAPRAPIAPVTLTPPCASAPRPLSAPVATTAPMAPATVAPRPPSSPAVRVAPSPVAGAAPARSSGPGTQAASGVAGFFSSLLPSANARPTSPSTAPARPATSPVAGGMPSRASEVFLDDDDTPILVIDDAPLPAGVSEPQQGKTFFTRSLVLRYDTAAVGVFLSAVVLGVTFMVGRATVANAVGGPREEQKQLALEGAKRNQEPPPAEELVSQIKPQSNAPSLAMTAPLEREEAPAPPPAPRQPAPTPPPAPAPQVDPEPTQPAATGASTDGKWWITVLQKGTKDGVEDVKKVLESKGFQVTLEKKGDRFYNVHVGSYSDRNGAQCKKDLAAVKEIQYKGRAFDEAYVEAMKRAQ